MSARTALVVEDDKCIQQLLRDALEAEGFQVLVEKDGEWAIKALERRMPDVLISDVLLPSVSGFELIEALRAMPGGDQVPVVVMSGIYKGKRHKRQAKEELGVLAYLDKPFEVSALLGAVRDALGDDYPGARKKSARRRPPPLATSTGRPVHADPLADAGAISETQQVEADAQRLAGGRNARGNLKHKPFAEVLSQLYRWRATGALLLRHERVKKIVYLKEGYPIFVKSNLLSECLGRVLVKEKIITEEECEASLEKMKSTHRQQGTVLIEMGCISPHNLVYGLQMQLELKLFEIFGWDEGDYLFSTRIDIPAQAVHLDMSLATIIYEGVRRTHTQKHLEDRLAPFLDSFLGVHEDPLHRFQEISLEADERRLVAMIDGRRTARDLIERSDLEETTTLQLLYALLAAEMIQPKTKRSRRKDTLIPEPAVDTPPPLKKRGSKAAARSVAGGAVEPQLSPTTMDAFEVPVEELRKRLAMRARALRRQNHFEVLGVSKAATTDEVTRAYYAQMREVHPDRMRLVVPADARHLAEQIAQRLTRAFEALGDDERRADYIRRLDEGPRTNVSDEVGRILKAETHFRKGTQAIEQEAWGDAEEALLSAIDLYPDEGEFFSHLGWVQARAAERLKGEVKTARLEEAEASIREGIQKNPRSDKGYLFLGHVLKQLGRDAEAVEQFEAAIQCNPDCTEALQELRLLSS